MLKRTMGKLIIIDRSEEAFADRQEAAALLAQTLKQLHIHADVVVGIPRGGVVVARCLAKALHGQLDITLTRKIGAPKNPELALGALGEEGHVLLNESLVKAVRAQTQFLEEEKTMQLQTIRDRQQLFRPLCPKKSFQDKTVVLTDDGVATGATAQAAIWSIRHEKPRQIIAAFPVGPKDTLERLASDADQVICLRAPHDFMSVGRFYRAFEQVSDEEVKTLLTAA